jgi:hypothetical protein
MLSMAAEEKKAGLVSTSMNAAVTQETLWKFCGEKKKKRMFPNVPSNSYIHKRHMGLKERKEITQKYLVKNLFQAKNVLAQLVGSTDMYYWAGGEGGE